MNIDEDILEDIEFALRSHKIDGKGLQLVKVSGENAQVVADTMKKLFESKITNSNPFIKADKDDDLVSVQVQLNHLKYMRNELGITPEEDQATKVGKKQKPKKRSLAPRDIVAEAAAEEYGFDR